MELIYKLPILVKGHVVKRPSAQCKTPYVADVLLEDGTTVMAHSAALGCCGLCDAGATVLMIPVTNPKNVCKYKIMLAQQTERDEVRYIGTDPKLAETLVELCLQKSLVFGLDSIQSYKREQKKLNSRFDFVGFDKTNKEFVLEVKNVPLADYEDITAKERKTKDYSACSVREKLSYFPDGYRKKKGDVVSPRALKHIQELAYLVEHENIRACLCFVIQRNDANRFQPSVLDPTYRKAVQEAVKVGVEIKTLQLEWREDGSCYFLSNQLPVLLDD